MLSTGMAVDVSYAGGGARIKVLIRSSGHRAAYANFGHYAFLGINYLVISLRPPIMSPRIFACFW